MVEIKTLKHIDAIEQLTDLYVFTFNHKVTTEFWKWKYVDNPLSAELPGVIVALDGSKIIGARPFLLNELWLGDKKIVAAQHCDTMVHKDYRGQGIFNRMGKYALNYLAEHNCSLSFGFPGPMSRKGFASQGYRKIMDTEILFHITNPVNVIKSKLKKDRLDFDDYHVEVSERYTAEMNILDSFRKRNIIDIVRSEENLRWRFDNNPLRSYRYILIKKEGLLLGYAIISMQKLLTWGNIGIIIDYLIKDDNINCFRAIVSKSLEEFNRYACPVSAIWTLGEPVLHKVLTENFGFKSSIKFPYRKFMDSGYMDLIVNDDKIADKINIYDQASWRVTYAYPNYT
ncbi:MAG: GNAT family N-acetyltransferase [Peptococcaceae bacterium]